MRLRGVAAAVAIAAALSCSSFGTSPAPLEEKEAGSPPAIPAEVIAPDAASARDAATSACAHTFCESFDGDPSWAGWARVEGAGLITADSTRNVSAPSSLRVESTPGGGVKKSYLQVGVTWSQHAQGSWIVNLDDLAVDLELP